MQFVCPNCGAKKRVRDQRLRHGPKCGECAAALMSTELVAPRGGPVRCTTYAKAVDPAHTDRRTDRILEDFTEAKRIEDALHQTLREMEAIMHNAPVGIVFTRDGRITRCNPQVLRHVWL